MIATVITNTVKDKSWPKQPPLGLPQGHGRAQCCTSRNRRRVLLTAPLLLAERSNFMKAPQQSVLVIAMESHHCHENNVSYHQPSPSPSFPGHSSRGIPRLLTKPPLKPEGPAYIGGTTENHTLLPLPLRKWASEFGQE